MRDPIAVLKSLTEKSKDESYKFQRLYRNLYNPEFYYLALKNIYANKGAMTPGADGVTLDCFSEKRIARIIESLKNHSYQPKPARREYIPKKSNPKKTARWASRQEMISSYRKWSEWCWKASLNPLFPIVPTVFGLKEAAIPH